MGRAMFSTSSVQFSVDGWGCVPSLLFDLRPNYEDNEGPPSKGPVQALPCSVPPALQQASADPRLCQRLLDTHGQVWVSLLGVTAPFSWVLVCSKFCLCPPRVSSPVLCKFWPLCGRVNGDLLQEGLAIPRSTAPEPLSL